MINKKSLFLIIFVFLAGTLLIGEVNAATSSFSQSASSFGVSSYSSFTSYGRPGGFSQFYTKGDLDAYWPILGNKEDCQSRKDLLLQVAPGGCQPMVVRSDLLEEQNVPVFCQLQSLKLNPSIDVKEITNIRFGATEKYPEIVAGTGFHPARAALRTSDQLIGSPLSNNIGYAVVVLKRTPNESAMPENVTVKLTAQVEFDARNTLGVGRAEFSLEPMSDEQWELNKIKNSFWNGRYSIRLEEAGADYATVSVYQGVQRVTTQKVQMGKTSEEIYLPGLYCRSGLQITYDGFVSAQKKARVEVRDDNGNDVYDVYEGSTFLDGKCKVNNVYVNPLDGTGSMLAYCGSETLRLVLNPKLLTIGDMIPAQDLDNKDNSGYLKIEPLRRDPSLYGKSIGVIAAVKGIAAIRDKIYGNIEACEAHITYPFITEDKAGYYSIQRANGSTSSADWKLFRRASIGEITGTSLEEDMKKDENSWMKSLKQEFITKCEKRQNTSYVSEKTYPEPAETKITESFTGFKNLAKDYPQEGETGKDTKYGEDGLKEAIDFAGEINKDRTKSNLIESFKEAYPDSKLVNQETYTAEQAKLNNVDSTAASKTIKVNNRDVTIRLISVDNPRQEQANAEFNWGGKTVKLGLGGMQEVEMRSGGKAVIELKELMDVDKVRVSVICPKQWEDAIKDEIAGSQTFMDQTSARMRALARSWRNLDTLGSMGLKLLSLKSPVDECGESLSLENVNMAKVARVRLTSNAKQLREEINLTVSIGIEKRAIQLTPDETKKRIDKLNSTLRTLENLNNKLKDVVSGLKAACFATSGVLTAKTFLTGLSGEGLARQEVMKGDGGWDQKCQDLVGQKKYNSLSQCFSANADKINEDVAAYAKGINNANSKIKQIEDSSMISAGITGGNVVDRNASAAKMIDALKSEHGTKTIKLRDGTNTTIDKLIDGNSYSRNDVSYEELRDMYAGLSSSGMSEVGQSRADNEVARIAKGIDERRQWSVVRESLAGSDFATKLGLKDKPVESYGSKNSIQGYYYGGVSSVDELKGRLPNDAMKSEVDKLSQNGRDVPTQIITYDNKPYLVVLGATSSTGLAYNTKKIYNLSQDPSGFKIDSDVTSNKDVGGKILERVSIYNKIDANSYNNQMDNPEVKYYETDPYKGMPAQVPIDVQNGWYVATKKTIGTMGNIKAFEANGRPSSFWLCNVGYNHRIEFFSGMGDDICSQFNLDTGQALNKFPGLSESEASKLVEKAIRALTEAADKYKAGIRSVRVLGQQYNVGSPATGSLGTQCQDFMDPNDCKLLFNVCDPVICPTSRCDFGGKYPVTDVIQSGIVGSTLLCLPNFPEVKVPICISGIQAGIDSFTSVLRSYRDCLQENLDTGKTVGICDQIHSIYMCEFFWKQAAPLANALIPKAFELATTGGQGTRGGGEYLTVQGAWDNAKSSMDYFTQSYAVNSIKAFQVRNTEEVGGELCKGFVSLNVPNKLKNLIEPDSPSQFYARFDAVKYSDATVPATSQYKVYYQIYAGQDSGVYYNIYLKGAPTTSYYYSSPTIQVDSGFAGKGQSVSQTRDFTAPEGYKELCVRINDQEQCGFGQVSTDFAINNLKDSYVANQMTQTGIKSESSCISGTVDPRSILATGGSFDSVGNGIYNYGVVRVCSTQNPGSPSDVKRFVDVGYCGDTKVRCWLDSRSVDNAIGTSNLGLKNATLDSLGKTAIANLEASGEYYSVQQAESEIEKIIDTFAALEKTFDIGKAEGLIRSIDTLNKKLYLNQQKAKLLLYRARTQKIIASNYAKGIKGAQTTALLNLQSLTKNYEYTLEGAYSDGSVVPMNIMKSSNGERTGVYIQNKGIYARNNSGNQVQVGVALYYGDNTYQITIDEDLIDSMQSPTVLRALNGNILVEGSQDLIEAKLAKPERGIVPGAKTSSTSGTGTTSSGTIVSYSLSQEYDSNDNFVYNGIQSLDSNGNTRDTNLFVKKDAIYYKPSSGNDLPAKVGDVKVDSGLYVISFDDLGRTFIEALGDSNLVKDVFILTGAKLVQGGKGIISSASSNIVEGYEFVLSKEYSPGSSERIEINLANGKSSGIYIQDDKIYSVKTRLQIGSVVEEYDYWRLNFDVQLEAELEDDTLKANVNLLKDGIIQYGSRGIELSSSAKTQIKNVQAGIDICAGNYRPFVRVVYEGGLTTGVTDYFGYRCVNNKIEVKMVIGKMKSFLENEMIFSDWTSTPEQLPSFSSGGLFDYEKNDVRYMLNAKDWKTALQMVNSLPSKSGKVSTWETISTWPEFPADPATKSSGIPVGTQVVKLESRYDSNSRIFVKVGDIKSNVYLEKSGIYALEKTQGSEMYTAQGIFLGSVSSGNILSVTQSNPVIGGQRVVDDRLYQLLNNAEIEGDELISKISSGDPNTGPARISRTYSGTYANPFSGAVAKNYIIYGFLFKKNGANILNSEIKIGESVEAVIEHNCEKINLHLYMNGVEDSSKLVSGSPLSVAYIPKKVGTLSAKADCLDSNSDVKVSKGVENNIRVVAQVS